MIHTLLALIPLFPLAAAAAIPFLGSRRAAGWTASGACFLSLAAVAALAGSFGAPVTVTMPWLTIGELELTVGLYLDGLSWWMACVVAAVCFVVLVYSISYTREEPAPVRFFAWMSFFTGAMLALVLAESFVVLFAAWEGVGAASYWLIAHRHHEKDARAAARKAFLMTRFGDVGMLLGWLLVLAATGSASIPGILETIDPAAAALPATLFLIAAVGKSAQLPLTAWLPDAMAGPTPVSALLHSATMVAAGVYLILRLFPLFEAAPHVLEALLWIGAATALVGAVAAVGQYDLKRILAWSTVSQIGEMMMALGLAGPVAAAFHLTTHAVFKSSLFLTAGAVEHEAGTRDLRELGGLRERMPWTAAVFGICALALAGFPPLAGFWSEEKILGAAQAHGAEWGVLMLVLILLAGLYIGRAFGAVFLGPQPEREVDEAPSGMLWPMLALGVGALAVGFLIRTPIEHVLPFASESHDLGWWRWAAIAASALGLVAGGLLTAAIGLLQPLGSIPNYLARGVDAIPGLAVVVGNGMATVARPAEGAAQTGAEAAGRSAPSLAAALAYFETGFDTAAAGIGRVVPLAAHGANRAERGFDTVSAGIGRRVRKAARGFDRAEGGFDAASRATAAAATALAGASEVAEARGFGAGIDRFAYGLREAGGRLRRLQSGKLYRYTMSLFVWVLAALALVITLSIL